MPFTTPPSSHREPPYHQTNSTKLSWTTEKLKIFASHYLMNIPQFRPFPLNTSGTLLCSTIFTFSFEIMKLFRLNRHIQLLASTIFGATILFASANALAMYSPIIINPCAIIQSAAVYILLQQIMGRDHVTNHDYRELPQSAEVQLPPPTPVESLKQDSLLSKVSIRLQDMPLKIIGTTTIGVIAAIGSAILKCGINPPITQQPSAEPPLPTDNNVRTSTSNIQLNTANACPAPNPFILTTQQPSAEPPLPTDNNVRTFTSNVQLNTSNACPALNPFILTTQQPSAKPPLPTDNNVRTSTSNVQLNTSNAPSSMRLKNTKPFLPRSAHSLSLLPTRSLSNIYFSFNPLATGTSRIYLLANKIFSNIHPVNLLASGACSHISSTAHLFIRKGPLHINPTVPSLAHNTLSTTLVTKLSNSNDILDSFEQHWKTILCATGGLLLMGYLYYQSSRSKPKQTHPDETSPSTSPNTRIEHPIVKSSAKDLQALPPFLSPGRTPRTLIRAIVASSPKMPLALSVTPSNWQRKVAASLQRIINTLESHNTAGGYKQAEPQGLGREVFQQRQQQFDLKSGGEKSSVQSGGKKSSGQKKSPNKGKENRGLKK